MTQRLNRHLERFRAMNLLAPGEKYIGAFFGRTQVELVWFFVMGPLALLTMRQYQVIATDQRIFFLRVSLLGKHTGIDAFDYNEIEEASFVKGLLAYKIFFRFKHGRTLWLDANFKALVAVEGLLFDEVLKNHLERAITWS